MATVSVSAQRKIPTRSLVTFAWLTLAFMVLVVLWGAVVRATSSGAGCGANWPLCNGDFFPHHPRLATVIEFTHRSMSGICTFLVATLVGWTFFGTDRTHKARTSVLWAAGLLISEAFFGAVLVLRHYVENNISVGRVVMQSIHFTNTMLLLASLALTGWFLQRTRNPRTNVVSAEGLRTLTLLAVVATIVVGATGSLAALADTLFPATNLRTALGADFLASSPLLIRMRWVHPAAAVLGFVCVLLLTIRIRIRLASLVMWLIGAQIVLGIADVLLLTPTWMQVLHLLGADLYWIALVVLAANVMWPESAGSGAQLTGK
jgi:cytochrome c oxidase assembly protein subunit 15